MKVIGWSLLILLLVHLLAVGGFVAWLGATDRLSEQRVKQVVDTFELTVQEEAQRKAEAERITAEAEENAKRAARLESVARGPRTFDDRLETEEQADELAMHRLERLHQETQDLRGQIERAKQVISEQKTQLQKERDAFDAFVEESTKQRQDEDFQKAVAMYEQLKPDQAKLMFQTLLNQGKTDDVVEYLAAMQLRKAAGVLKKFETPPEIEQATQLIEQLRERGVFLPGDSVVEAGNQ